MNERKKKDKNGVNEAENERNKNVIGERKNKIFEIMKKRMKENKME